MNKTLKTTVNAMLVLLAIGSIMWIVLIPLVHNNWWPFAALMSIIFLFMMTTDINYPKEIKERGAYKAAGYFTLEILKRISILIAIIVTLAVAVILVMSIFFVAPCALGVDTACIY